MWQAGEYFPLFLKLFGDVQTAQTQLTKWQAVDKEVKAYGRGLTHCNAVLITYTMLEDLRQGSLYQQMCYWDVGFDNADTWAQDYPNVSGVWQLEDEDGNSAWCCLSESYAALVKALCAAQVTDHVSPSEVAAWLPGVDCRAVHDRWIAEAAMGATISTFLAMAAVNLEKPRSGTRYHQYWLRDSLNPLKDCYAHAHLGAVLTMAQNEDDGDAS